MARSRFNNVQISGVVACAPKQKRCIHEDEELFGSNVEQIEQLKRAVGINERRVTAPGTTAADLCESAARKLLESAGFKNGEIDAIICVTQTPDFHQPCNAAVLHGRLNLSKHCAALDVNLGCSGYVYGLWLAHMMAGGGGCEKVLLLAGDTMSRMVNPRDRSLAPLFGDGGSATLVEASPGGRAAWFSLGTDGQRFDKLIVPAGGARMPCSAETKVEKKDQSGNIRSAENLFMDGLEVFNFSITEELGSVRDLLAYSGCTLDAVDYFVFHQANRYILKNIARRLEIDFAKVPMKTIEQFGNQSSASIPFALCGELRDVLMDDSGAKRLLLSGFGVGLSWGSALLTLEKPVACEIIECN